MPSSPPKRPLPIVAPQPPFKRLLRAVQRHWNNSAGALFSRPVSASADSEPSDPAAKSRDKRRQPRIQLANTSVHVTDGCLFATAQIDNISPSGICLCKLPEQLYRSQVPLTVFSNDNPAIPVLHIEPRWETTDWAGKTIGAAILNTSDAWRLFFVRAAGQLEA